MPINPYDDRKVSLRRPPRNGDLYSVRASFTGRKANVTEALLTIRSDPYLGQISTYEAEIFSKDIYI